MTDVIGLLHRSGHRSLRGPSRTAPAQSPTHCFRTVSRADPFLSIRSSTSPFPSPQPAPFPPARAHPLPFCSRVSPVLSCSVAGPQAYCHRSALFPGTGDGDRPLECSGVAGPGIFRGPGTQLSQTGDATLTDLERNSHRPGTQLSRTGYTTLTDLGHDSF